ncbi:hypothetical protein BC829DRAFT_230258 [Chytridium lagenaria]|nr:hypothetical protein BC829DRAFT_230258 [Chytridium lagenaria]
MLFRGLLHDDTVNSEGDDGRRKRSNSDSNRHHHHRQSNSNNNTRRRKPALRTTTVRSANEAFESHPSSPTSVFSVRSLPGGTREAPTSSSSHPQRLHSLHSPEGALRFPSSPLAWMTSPSSSDSTRSQQGPTSSGETSPINMQIVTSGKGNADGGLAPPHPRSPPESLRSTSGGGGGGVDHADRRSVSFVDQPRQSMEHSAASDYDDFDDDGSESWQTSSTISMSATSHAWIQDLVRLSRNLSRRRAILFLLRRIGNNVPPKAINIFSMAISFSALAPDVKERLRFLGIRNHLHLINLIIIARLVYSFLLAILVMSIVLLCVFTLREDDRSRFISLKTLFSLDAVCVIIFTIEILFHVNSIPSWADRQALHNSRSSGMKKGSSSYPWFILMLRPTLKNSASTVATLAVLDSMGNNPLREQPPAANPSEVHLNIPTSPNDPTLLNVPNAATSPLTSSQIQAHFASMAPHVAAAVEAGGMIKHHSLADPGWLWLIFDCLSTFPFYIEITFATLYTNNGLDAAITNMYGWTGLPPALWILRLFRIFRVFKFLEKSEKMKVMTRAFIHSMDGIWLLLILLPILLVLFSFGIFFAEQTGEYLDENGFWRYRTDDVFSPFQNVPDTVSCSQFSLVFTWC